MRGALTQLREDTREVKRFEWHKQRRREYWGWTSHSWIEAFLVDECRVRCEFFADTGLFVGFVLRDQITPNSEVFEGRSACSNRFVRPLSAARLCAFCEEAAAQPYSLRDWNCHHFVLDVWNKVVVESLRKTHYPDRVKTGIAAPLLWLFPVIGQSIGDGVLSSLSSRSTSSTEVFGRAAVHAHQADASTDETLPVVRAMPASAARCLSAAQPEPELVAGTRGRSGSAYAANWHYHAGDGRRNVVFGGSL
eukprot:NODE_12306_length_1233_cov_3.584087.p2 GENE.NODE_12306_length_1233_cov_3.584087~~NODE_12306_length_1233_cov_3.584087.p2  ORF type:complete len:250 (+),score=61.15 NODE_12306_length_1233_cov_3.584087:227-976(+)